MQRMAIKKMTLALLLSTMMVPSSHALFDQVTTKQKWFALLVAALAPGTWEYLNRKETLKRYNFQELKEGKNVLENLSHLYYDGLFGTPPQDDSVKLKSDNGEFKVQFREKQPGSGLIGTIHTNFKSIVATASILATSYLTLNLDRESLKELIAFFLDPKKKGAENINKFFAA